MTTKVLSVEENLDKLSDQKVAQLMRWYQPLNIERMGHTYKKWVEPAETAEPLMIGYTIKRYLEKRIGEPKQ